MDRREAIRLAVGATTATMLPLPIASDPDLQRPWTISMAAGVLLPAGRHRVSLVAKLAARRFRDVWVGPDLLFESDPCDFGSNLPGYSFLEAWIDGPVLVSELRINQNGDLKVYTDRGVIHGVTVFLTEAPRM